MLSKLVFANIPFYHVFFFFFFFITDLYILISTVTAQVFNPFAELIIPIGIPGKEANTEIEIHSVTLETKISVQYNLKPYKIFCASYSSIHFGLFL